MKFVRENGLLVPAHRRRGVIGLSPFAGARPSIAFLGGAAVQVVGLDEFTDTDATLLTSHTVAPIRPGTAAWANRNYAGTWAPTILGNAALGTSTAANAGFSTADWTIAAGKIRFPWIATGAGTRPSVVWRETDVDNHFVAWGEVGGTLSLYRVESASFNLEDTDGVVITASTNYYWQVTMLGNLSTVELLDSSLNVLATMSVSSAFNAAATRHGWGSGQNMAGTITLADWRITAS